MGINVEDYYRRYSPMVLRRCRFLLKDEDAALDALQEVFIRLVEKKDSIRDEYPSSLLYRIATNTCLNMIKAGKGKAAAEDDIISSIASMEEIPEEKTVIRDFLDRIFVSHPASTREIAFMHYVDEMTLEQVASEVGMSVSGVRKRLRNLRGAAVMMREEAE